MKRAEETGRKREIKEIESNIAEETAKSDSERERDRERERWRGMEGIGRMSTRSNI